MHRFICFSLIVILAGCASSSGTKVQQGPLPTKPGEVLELEIFQEFASDTCNVNLPMEIIIRKERELRELFVKMGELPTLGTEPIDFNKQMVIGVFMGPREVGASIYIDSIFIKDGRLIVLMKHTSGAPGDAITSPYHIVVVPRYDHIPVEFRTM